MIPGANGCYPTAALRDVGGWDETHPFANEDLRVSERLRNAGYALRYTKGTYVVHRAPRGLEALYQLWRWHRPGGPPRILPGICSRAVENLAKSILYTADSLREGRIEHALLDLAVGPLHVYWDIRG